MQFHPRHKLSTKKNIIEMARELDVYFARLYPISKPEESSSSPATQQYLAVSHSGVKLVVRQKGLPTDTLEVRSIIEFEILGCDVAVPTFDSGPHVNREANQQYGHSPQTAIQSFCSISPCGRENRLSIKFHASTSA